MSDDYTFDELKDRVFTVGNDNIVNDIRGVICGRISRVNEGIAGYFEKTRQLEIQYKTIRSNGKVFFDCTRHACVVEDIENNMKLSVL